VENKVSVIIVSYNTGPIIYRTLDYTLAQEGLKEIIIVDNGNPPEVLEKLQLRANDNPLIKIITGHGNVGFSKGCNIGEEQASGEYILLLNPDCLLPSGSIAKTIGAMEASPESWLAGCQMVKPDGTPQGVSKRNLLTPFVALSQAMHLYKISKKFPVVNMAEEEGDAQPVNVPAISGAFMMMRKDKYNEIGKMDEDYFFHVEDLDLCLRINNAGGKILYVPSVKAVHYHGSSDVSSFFVEKNKAKGFITYFKKHQKKIAPFGLFFFVVIGIYLRLALKMVPLSFKKFVDDKFSASHRRELERRRLVLLNKPVDDPDYVVDKFKFEPVLVAGATGQVGLSVVRRLLASDIETIAIFHNTAIDYDHSKLKWVQGDVEKGQFNLLSGMSPKTLIHTPAIWDLPERIEKYASMGVERLICFSSTSIMGKAKSENLYEQQLIRKFIKAEKDVKDRCGKFGIKWTILRPTMIYGFGLDKNVSSVVRFIKTFGFFPVEEPGTGLRQPVHADDLASSAVRIIGLEQTHGRTYELSGATKITYLDMVRKIFFTMGRKDKTKVMKGLYSYLDIFSFLARKPDINGEVAKRMNEDLVFDYARAAEDFSYHPKAFLSRGLEDLGLERQDFEIKRGE